MESGLRFLLWRLSFAQKTTKSTEVEARANVDQLPLIKDSIHVARVSADAAQKQANASLIQANVSEQMVKQNEDFIESAKIQANTPKYPQRAAESSH